MFQMKYLKTTRWLSLGILWAACLMRSTLITGQTTCRNPHGKTGTCIPIYNCPSLLDMVRRDQPSDYDFLRSSRCSNESSRHVCCPRDTTTCRNPNGNIGTCVSILDCPSLLEVIRRNQSSDQDFLRSSRCSNESTRHVCCTRDTGFAVASRISEPDSRNNLLPQPPQCGAITLSDKILNGKDTALNEYPWMVLLEYNRKGGRRSISCGGSLINQRYVLTAAHCVTGSIEREIGTLAAIRLGEYDVTSEVDCIDNDCNNPVLTLGIETILPHPQYNRVHHNDIALIRLNSDVTNTDFISPICLPLASNRQNISVGDILTVAGWGHTEEGRRSNVKKQLGVPYTDHAECSQKFATRRIGLIAAQMCAGGVDQQDSCRGDSGGPLMRQAGSLRRWFLKGVVSFGNRCGLEGWPGIYTKVADYVDWIQQNMRP